MALAVFLLITLAHVNPRRDTGATLRHLGLAALMTLLTLAAFAFKTYEDDPQNFVAMIVIFALAIVIDLVWKRMSGAAPTQTVVEETTSEGALPELVASGRRNRRCAISGVIRTSSTVRAGPGRAPSRVAGFRRCA